MEATFKLDGCHTLRIRTDVARVHGSNQSVGVQLDHEPMRLPDDPVADSSDQVRSSFDMPVPLGTRILFSTAITSSEARAIASAMLSAATESK